MPKWLSEVRGLPAAPHTPLPSYAPAASNPWEGCQLAYQNFWPVDVLLKITPGINRRCKWIQRVQASRTRGSTLGGKP
jgi:hypothetical protein